MGAVPQAVASSPAGAPAADVHSFTSVASAVPAKSNWTEHISPEGFKYYHNSVTGESRVGIYLNFLDVSYFCPFYFVTEVFLHATKIFLHKSIVGET